MERKGVVDLLTFSMRGGKGEGGGHKKAEDGACASGVY